MPGFENAGSCSFEVLRSCGSCACSVNIDMMETRDSKSFRELGQLFEST